MACCSRVEQGIMVRYPMVLTTVQYARVRNGTKGKSGYVVRWYGEPSTAQGIRNEYGFVTLLKCNT